ncbi:MAG TPA: glycosyltransferase family 2 protein [Gemmatimonadaceae bacterium]|nr:glycosyltransferase family 2 protein [Gemmatimonadaceae bacterium]
MTEPARGSPAPDVTAVIAAHDESANIRECVESLKWAREVIVVENDSSDDTVALARTAGARVISPPFTTIGAARNSAIEKASTSWVLVVDADERCTPELAREIADTVAGGTNLTAYRVKRRNFFLGREIKHGGWGGVNDHPVRLFRREHRYNDSLVHEHVEVPGTPGQLSGALLHYTYTSLDQYFEKFDRYSRWWADQHYGNGRRGTAAAVVFKPPARFFKMFFLKGGFRDGTHGLILACLAAASVMAKYARLWERSIRNDTERRNKT